MLPELTEHQSCWWMVRHAPLKNAAGLYVPEHAEIINDVDVASLHVLKARIPEDAVWFSSDLLRARQTLELLKVEAEQVVAFREQSFGSWHGRSYDDVWQETKHWPTWDTPAEIVPQEGESFVQMMGRVQGAVSDIAARHGGKHIAVMAHAGVIRSVLVKAWELPAEEALALDVPYLSAHAVLVEGDAWSAYQAEE